MTTILSINIMHYFLSKNQEDVSSGSWYDSVKRAVSRHEEIISRLLLKKPKGFECQVFLLFFVLNDMKIS